MIVVNAEHVLCPNAKTKASACEFNQSDFECYFFCDFSARDEVDPGVAVNTLDSQSIRTLAVGKAIVIWIFRMRFDSLLFSSSYLHSLQLLPQSLDLLIFLPQLLLQSLLKQPYLHLVGLVPRHLFLPELYRKHLLLELELNRSFRDAKCRRVMGEMVEEFFKGREVFFELFISCQFSPTVDG